MPATTENCPKCARSIPASAPRGLCSVCLVSLLLAPLEEPADESEADENETDDESPAPATANERAGDYELLERIGRGGMGVVFRARDLRLNRLVALKLILTGKLASDIEVKRFRIEAEAVARLEHSNIVPIYDVGMHEGRHFFAMKLVEGVTLSDHILQAEEREEETRRNTARETGAAGDLNPLFPVSPFPLSDSASMIVKIARAVHHAHQRGILHRDLKPGNILIDAVTGEPMVMDFGLARRLEEDSNLTASGMVMGSPSYMAPEQAGDRPGEVTTAADVYSLGAILYELLAGRPPFVGDTPLLTMRKVMEEEPVPPSRVALEDSRSRDTSPSAVSPSRRRVNRKSKIVNPVDRDLETICLQCLEKDPTRRYTSAAALADDLERWLRREPILARPCSPGERAWKWIRRHPALAALIGVTGAALAGFLTLQLVNEAQLTHERDLARHQERRATTNELRALAEARRAESNALTARLNLYAADIHSAARFIETGQVGPALALLKNHEPAPGQADVRGFEWHWLRGRAAGDPATVLRGHPRAVQTLAFSADGRHLASGDHRSVFLWDTANWQSTASFPNPNDPAVWEAKGEQGLALIQREPKKALELLTGRTGLEGEIAPSRPDVAHASWALAFSPDGHTLLTAGKEEYLKFWDVKMGRLRNWHASKKADGVFLPDGRVAALGEGGPAGRTIEIVDTATGRSVQTLSVNCASLAASANGRWLAILSGRQDVAVWDASNLTEVARFRTTAPVHGRLAISADGRRVAAAASDGELVRIHDAALAWRQSAADRLGSQVRSLAFSPDGNQLAIGMRDSTVRLHDATGGAVGSTELRRYTGHHAEVSAVAWGPGGELVSASEDGTVRVWNLAQAPREERMLRRFTGFVVSPDEALFAGVAEGNRIVLWDGRTREPRALNEREGFKPLGFRPEESALLVSQRLNETQASIELWRLADGATLRTMTLDGGRHMLASPRGDRLILWSKGEAVVYDVANGAELARFIEGRQGFQADSAAVFDGERFIVRTFPVGVTVWEVAAGRRVAVLRMPDGTHSDAIAATPDGALAVTGDNDSFIRVWNARDGRLLHKLAGHSGGLKALTVSPDGRTLASFGDDLVLKLWSLPTGRELMTMSRSIGISRLRFLPDGRAILWADPRRGAHVWRVEAEEK
jgi:serine/threonine protein kinase/WD40 repeat protein